MENTLYLLKEEALVELSNYPVHLNIQFNWHCSEVMLRKTLACTDINQKTLLVLSSIGMH